MNIKNSTHVITSQDIYDDVLEKIINIEYKPGEKLSENELCNIYNTTRHTVRGALAILKEKGFVEIHPQRGTFVSRLNIKEIDEMLFIREAVTQEALKELMHEGIDPKYLKALKDCVKAQKKLGDLKANAKEFYVLDDELNRLLLEAIGKGGVFEMLSDSCLHIRRWKNVEAVTLDRINDLPEEHEAIILAIEKQDVENGEKIMHQHIDLGTKNSDKVREQLADYFV